MTNASTSDIYDALAPHYRQYADRKSAYLSAVDKFVLDHFPVGADSLLDVGAGDGIRAMELARRKKIGYTVLSEPSAAMVAKCRELDASEVWHAAAADLPLPKKPFRVITCLWNVLGHLSGIQARVNALERMRQLLSADGVLFLDVNNRHNAASYGWFTVLMRVVMDAIAFDERRGDVTFQWQIGNHILPARGHLFTPAEIKGIICDSGLSVQKMIAIDYVNGETKSSPLKGQLVFMLNKSGGP